MYDLLNITKPLGFLVFYVFIATSIQPSKTKKNKKFDISIFLLYSTKYTKFDF